MKTEIKKLPLGGPAWLRAMADEKEEMSHALPSEMFADEDKREVQGLRDAATRMLRLEVALESLVLSCRSRAGHFIPVKAPSAEALQRALDALA